MSFRFWYCIFYYGFFIVVEYIVDILNLVSCICLLDSGVDVDVGNGDWDNI